MRGKIAEVFAVAKAQTAGRDMQADGKRRLSGDGLFALAVVPNTCPLAQRPLRGQN